MTYHRVTVEVTMSYTLDIDEEESHDAAAEHAIDKVRHDLGAVVGHRDAREAVIVCVGVEDASPAHWAVA